MLIARVRFLVQTFLIGLLLVSSTSVATAFAQVPVNLNFSINNLTTTPRPGDGHNYIHDLNETVNPANGQVSIRIAAPMPHERALNFPVMAYFYDSNDHRTFQMMTSGGTCLDEAGIGWLNCYVQLTPPRWIAPYRYGTQNPEPNTLLTGLATSILGRQPGWEGGAGSMQGCAWTAGYTYMDLSGSKHALHVGITNFGYGTSQGGVYWDCAGLTGMLPDQSGPYGFLAGDNQFKALIVSGTYLVCPIFCTSFC